MSESRDALIARRYAQPGEGHENNTWSRVADVWSGGDEHAYFPMYSMMAERRGFFNTPALANAGKPIQCASACYVLPINDSLTKGPGSIAQTLMDATAVHQYGGGTGFSFGRLRPKGSIVSTTGRPAPGGASFLKGYSDWFKQVTQAGLRDAANMCVIPCDHPDVMDFITAKQREGTITNFNISVAVTDDFMRDPAPEVWKAIVEGAWSNGEPGVLFIDTVNNDRLHPEVFEATNPCGEVPLLDYEACVLGSINLAAHVDGLNMDWDALADTIETMVTGLDNIVDLQDYPLDIIRDTHHRYRKIGLGVMGYADVLCMLGYAYGSQQALDFTEQLAWFIHDHAYLVSEHLGEVRGVYPGWTEGMPYRRNLCCMVIAPTGSISRLAECSFGIEPHFDCSSEGLYDSFILGGRYTDFQPYHDHPMFTPASQVEPEQHVLTQAAWQKYTDQAVSKTVNLPAAATREDVARIYRMAWETGCKGITVLREGSREDVVIGTTDPNCKSGVCNL
jgi:ribonucleoside-diphosphate reductase alpha chain